MSSHWAWCKKVAEQHDAEKPFAPENGQPLKFRIGDKVIYTNDNGAKFNLIVTGLFQREEGEILYCTGKRYYLNWDCHWMPATESSLELDKGTTYRKGD